MLFTELFGITKDDSDNWFDPILDLDTKLFIDPFLLFDYKSEHFTNSHEKIIEFFNIAFELAAKSSGDKNSLSYKKLLSVLSFPEVDELCLGYTSESTRGLGSGKGFSRTIANTILESVGKGIEDIRHFEEMGILEEGIGADRISDICANILKADIITYTQKICLDKNVPMLSCKVKNAEFSYEQKRWIDREVNLPYNPSSERPILLVPKDILRELPSINSDDFLDWAWDNENVTLRNDFNYEVKNSIRKKDIVEIARSRTDLLQRYVDFRERRGSSPYDLEIDKYGVYKWHEQAKNYYSKNPAELPNVKDRIELPQFVDKLINIFETFIVDNSGYKLLWNERPRKPKKEEASQLLFLGIVKHYCQANNIDISREVNIGRGPVDFKFSSGYEDRVLLEVKRASNTKFISGFTKQLPQYLKSEGITVGVYLVIVQKEEEFTKALGLQQKAKEINEQYKVNIKLVTIDATDDKSSASNL